MASRRTLSREVRWSTRVAYFALAGLVMAGVVPACNSAKVAPRALVPSTPFAQTPSQGPRPCSAAINESGDYGLTDISAVTGNQSLTSAEDCAGTVTVLRWPNPSFDNQVRFVDSTTSVPGTALDPNDGSFLGVVVGNATQWLSRGFQTSQTNPDPQSDAVITTYSKPGITVTVTDVTDPSRDVLVRHIQVTPPDAASQIVAFAHFDPTLNHQPDDPTLDWLFQDQIQSVGSYDPESGTISTVGAGVTLSMGFGSTPSAFQVGQDAYWSGAVSHPGPADAFDAASSGVLPGSQSAPGPQVDGALETRPDPSGTATFFIAAGHDAAGAVSQIFQERRLGIAKVLSAKQSVLSKWLAGCPVPGSPDPLVADLARRAEISIWQASDPGGAIVASIATQSPYSEDWLRDGAFINHLLDLCGQHQEVARHDLFYASLQVQQGRPSPQGTSSDVPPGNWAMNYYADGVVGGPIPWEIDETGFATWTLVDHFELTHDIGYLRSVYPAIEASANFFAGPGLNPASGLSVGASEDDNVPKVDPPTMHASGPALLALQSAVAAADALNQMGDVNRWTTRENQERAAIESTYHAPNQALAWTDSYEDGGWALWPVVVDPAGDPRMAAQANLVWQSIMPDFQAPGGAVKSGSYEATGLLGMAVEGRATGNRPLLNEANQGLEWLAHNEAIPGTDLLGETWAVRDGVVATGVSQPHVWEMTLFTLVALELWGPVSMNGAAIQ